MRVITFLIPLNNAYSAPDKQVAEFFCLRKNRLHELL